MEDGGLEYEYILKKKPKTNIIEMDIELEGLRLAYQPHDEPFDPAVETVHRPDNVKGSYAVFHETKRDNKYQTGKFGHLYRPKLIDADGNEIWAEFNEDAQETKKLKIIMPEDFLRKAKYPIVVDPTLGVTTIGGTTSYFSEDRVSVLLQVTPSEDGTAESIAMYLKHGRPYTLGLYDDSSGLPNNLLKDTAEFTPTGEAWYTEDLDSDQSITNGTPIWIGQNHDTNSGNFYYDTDATYDYFKHKASTYSSGVLPDPFPSSPTAVNNRKYSTYINYTTSSTETKTFTMDVILQEEFTDTFTMDVILKEEFTDTFTMDVIVKEQPTETFTMDVVVIDTFTDTFTMDVVLQDTFTDTFTIDTILVEQFTDIFTIDVIIKEEVTNTFTIDVVVIDIFTDTFTIDIVVVDQFTDTFTMDVVIQEQVTDTFTMDVILVDTFTDTFTIDVILSEEFTDTFTMDVILSEIFTDTFTIDIVLEEQDVTKTFTIDVVLSGEAETQGKGGSGGFKRQKRQRRKWTEIISFPVTGQILENKFVITTSKILFKHQFVTDGKLELNHIHSVLGPILENKKMVVEGILIRTESFRVKTQKSLAWYKTALDLLD